jgi:hypothetical protein
MQSERSLPCSQDLAYHVNVSRCDNTNIRNKTVNEVETVDTRPVHDSVSHADSEALENVIDFVCFILVIHKRCHAEPKCR